MLNVKVSKTITNIHIYYPLNCFDCGSLDGISYFNFLGETPYNSEDLAFR